MLDVVVVYQQGDFYHDSRSGDLQAKFPDEETWYHRQFEVFRAMYQARDYRLVLSASCVDGGSGQELERAVVVEWAMGGIPLEIEIHYTMEGR